MVNEAVSSVMQPVSQVTIGIDLGGTSTRVGVYDAALQLLAQSSMQTLVPAGPQACVDAMATMIRKLLAELGLSATDVLGIGIGSPGPINLRLGVLGVLPNLPGWEYFPLRQSLATATGMPVVLESDANAAAIAEWKLGAGKDTQLETFGMLTLGTGVGSGFILGGRVWHGMFGMGGEAGHATVQPGGWQCGCGSKGCLEAYASANGLLRLAKAAVENGEASPALREIVLHPEGFTPLHVATLAQSQGDRSASLTFERLGYYLGLGLSNLINTLDLPMIVIGGGVGSAWPLFAPEMFRTVREHSFVYRLVAPTQLEVREVDRTFICPAQLGPAAGLMGAALLPRMESLRVS